MRVCAVLNCKRRGEHSFPTDENMRQKWIKATRVDKQRKIGWQLRKFSSICSNHFTPSDYDIRGKRRPLKKTAVPSVFPWTPKSPTSPTNRFESEDSSDEDSSSVFETSFNPANASKNYSRSDPPIQFVEEYPSLNVELIGESNDPLQVNDVEDDRNASDGSSPGPYNNSSEVIMHSSESQDKPVKKRKIKTNKNQILQCNKSVQTSTKPELVVDSNRSAFSVYTYMDSDNAIQFFTGLETFEKLMYVFNTLGDCSNLIYLYDTTPKKIDALEQFFIALMMLHRHTEFIEIAMLCLISVKEVADIFITWICFMALQWRNLDMWAEIDVKKSNMPLNFYDNNPMTREVQDDTKYPNKKPGLLSKNVKGKKGMLHRLKMNPSFPEEGDQNDPETIIKDNTPSKMFVETIMGRLKKYHILKRSMSQTIASDISFVSAMLVNFRTNIVNKYP